VENFIEKNIRRYRNFLIINIVLLILILFITSFFINDFYNLLLGPFELDSKTVSYIINNSNNLEEIKNNSITYNGLMDHVQSYFFPRSFSVTLGDFIEKMKE